MENNNITPYSLCVTSDRYHESEKTSVLGKRKREIGESEQEEVNEEEYLSKNQKSFYSLGYLSLLPDELIAGVFSHVNPQSCLKFCWASKVCAQFAEDHVWSMYAARKSLNFRWAVCQERSYPNQENYLLSSVFVNYIIVEPLARLGQLDHPTENIKSVVLPILHKYRRFLHLKSEKFRYFELFVLKDLPKLIKCTPRFVEYISKLSDKILPKIEANISGNSQWGGELLWYGLHTCSYPHLSRAIDQGATCAGLLSLCVHHSKVSATCDAPYTWSENLILQGAEKGDMRGFESYLDMYPSRASAFKELSFFPTSCFDVAYRKLERGLNKFIGTKGLDRSGLNEELCSLFELAIDSIKNKEIQVIPQEKLAQALAFIGHEKLFKGKLEEAENLFTRAIEAIKSPMKGLLLDAVAVKFAFKKYEDGEALLVRAKEVGGEGNDEKLDAAVIQVKIHLKKYSEARELIERAIEIYGNSSRFLPLPLENLLAIMKLFDKNESH